MFGALAWLAARVLRDLSTPQVHITMSTFQLGKMFLVRFVMYSVGYAREKSAAAVKRDKGDNVKAL